MKIEKREASLLCSEEIVRHMKRENCHLRWHMENGKAFRFVRIVIRKLIVVSFSFWNQKLVSSLPFQNLYHTTIKIFNPDDLTNGHQFAAQKEDHTTSFLVTGVLGRSVLQTTVSILWQYSAYYKFPFTLKNRTNNLRTLADGLNGFWIIPTCLANMQICTV